MTPSLVPVWAVATLVGLAAGWDLATRRIPNGLTGTMVLAGLGFHALAPAGSGWLLALEGLALGAALLLVPFLAQGGGGGDVKLLAAMGAWLGPWHLLMTFVLSMLAASILVLSTTAWVVIRRIWAKNHGRFQGTTRRGELATPGRPRVLPFAVPVAVATWLWLTYVLELGRF